MKEYYIRIEKQEFYQLIAIVEEVKKDIQHLQQENKIRFNVEPQINCLEKDANKLSEYALMLVEKYGQTEIYT